MIEQKFKKGQRVYVKEFDAHGVVEAVFPGQNANLYFVRLDRDKVGEWLLEERLQEAQEK